MVDTSALPLLSVDTAPKVRRERYGPCLVTPGAHGAPWAVGYKEEGGWYSHDGTDRLAPRWFMLLPQPPD